MYMYTWYTMLTFLEPEGPERRSRANARRKRRLRRFLVPVRRGFLPVRRHSPRRPRHFQFPVVPPPARPPCPRPLRFHAFRKAAGKVGGVVASVVVVAFPAEKVPHPRYPSLTILSILHRCSIPRSVSRASPFLSRIPSFRPRILLKTEIKAKGKERIKKKERKKKRNIDIELDRRRRQQQRESLHSFGMYDDKEIRNFS